MSTREPVRVTIRVEANPRVEEFEIDRDEWDAMTPAARKDMLDDAALESVNNAGGYGWNLDDPDDEAATES